MKRVFVVALLAALGCWFIIIWLIQEIGMVLYG